nr:CDP-alcohol phosphatidyltransferase family protein [Ardenticatena sp.]
MTPQPTAGKLPPEYAFYDLSGFGSRLTQRAVARLAPSRAQPLHLTLGFLLAGLGAALALICNQPRSDRLAALLLLVKHLLDGMDGSLARIRQRPSRLGRYADSVADFVVNAALFAAIAYRRGNRPRDWLAALWGLLSMLLQCSLYNYYYVLYRHTLPGERTSLPDERAARPYPWDPPRATRLFQRAYLLIYGWQDRFVANLDRLMAGPTVTLPPRPFMTALSLLGLGSQLAIIAALAWRRRINQAPAIFGALLNAYAFGLLAWRRRLNTPTKAEERSQ